MNQSNQLKTFAIRCSQKAGFSPFFTTYSDKQTDVVFFPGCALAGADKRLSLKILDVLRRTEKNCGLMSGCCGKPSVFMDFEDLYQNNMLNLQRAFDLKKVKRIITACPNCHVVFSEALANTEIEVTFLWNYLLNNNQALFSKKSYNKLYEHGPIFLHDACATRKNKEIHDAVREVLQLMKIPYTEFKHCGDGTVCCGKKNMLHTTHPDKYLHLAGRRAEEANLEDGMIITYCQGCASSFTDVGTHTLSLAEIFFGGQEDLRPHGGFNYWKNRFEIAIQARQE